MQQEVRTSRWAHNNYGELTCKARELFKHAADVVKRYAEVAQQVSHSVLPDLQLAVDEQEPAFAESLLEMVKKWVAEALITLDRVFTTQPPRHSEPGHLWPKDMKKDSDAIRSNYGELPLGIWIVKPPGQAKHDRILGRSRAAEQAASRCETGRGCCECSTGTWQQSKGTSLSLRILRCLASPFTMSWMLNDAPEAVTQENATEKGSCFSKEQQFQAWEAIVCRCSLTKALQKLDSETLQKHSKAFFDVGPSNHGAER